MDNFLYTNNHSQQHQKQKVALTKRQPSFPPSSSTSGSDSNTHEYEDDNGDISYFDDGDEDRGGKELEDNASVGFGLLCADIEDYVRRIDEVLKSEANSTALLELLENMTLSVDKFTKSLKDALNGGGGQAQRVHGRLVESLSRILDVRGEGTGASKTLRQHACRHLLKLLLVKFPATQLEAGDVRVLLRTIHDLYLSATTSEEEEASISEQTGGAQPLHMVEGGIDQILEFLSIVWDQVEKAFKGALNPSNLSTSPIDTTCAVAVRGEERESVGALKMFLEAGVYAAGVVRVYSTKETNRKRLCLMGAVSGLSGGMRVVLQVMAAVGKRQESNSMDTTIALSQLGYMVVQITSTIRNFTLESSSREHLLSSSTVIIVCSLLRAFPNNAELMLNCVRVTAKLSQFEPFRSQLNQKVKYVSYLAAIIVNEGNSCRRVMNGDTTVSWPSWFTWPLLSRTAFTLGNLTTNNDANRTLIASDCKCLMPLIVLLQTCSCSLMHLYTTSKAGHTSDDDEEEEDEDEVVKETTEFSTDREPKSVGGGYIPTSFDHTSEPDNNNQDDGCAESELNDATVKLLRLFANLTINESIGSQLARRRDTSKMLLELLACSDEGSDGREELHLNVVAACTNLTFYSCRLESAGCSSGGEGAEVVGLSPQAVHDLQSLATRLSNCLFHSNKEVVLESARALGNLTRNEQVIESLCSNQAAEALVLLLDSSDFDILIAVTGALVNISANVHSVDCLCESRQPTTSLAQIMRKASFKNLQLTTLVCQVFHNLLLHERPGFSDVVRGGIGDSLFELVDAAEDLIEEEEEGGGRYVQFVRVGRLVLDFVN